MLSITNLLILPGGLLFFGVWPRVGYGFFLMCPTFAEEFISFKTKKSPTLRNKFFGPRKGVFFLGGWRRCGWCVFFYFAHFFWGGGGGGVTFKIPIKLIIMFDNLGLDHLRVGNYTLHTCFYYKDGVIFFIQWKGWNIFFMPRCQTFLINVIKIVFSWKLFYFAI